MTFSYSLAGLSEASTATSSVSKVRRLIGDTSSGWFLLHDEEIRMCINSMPVLTFAAAASCDLIAAGFAREVNTENSALRVSAAARHKQYMDLADRLRKMGPGDIPGGDGAGTPLAAPYVGGAVATEVDALQSNDGYLKSAFTVGQDDFPGSAQTPNRNDFDV